MSTTAVTGTRAQPSHQSYTHASPHVVQVAGGSAEGRLDEIPSEVFAEVLQRVQRYVGGIQPTSTLIETPPPAVTMAMLAALKEKHH